MIIALSLTAIILCAAAMVTASVLSAKKNASNEKTEYFENMKTVTASILLSGVSAENMGNLINNVWHDAIWNEYDQQTIKYTYVNGEFVDFNQALDNLFSNSDFMNSQLELKSTQTEISKMMMKLTSPPEEYKEAYSVLKEYYQTYLKLSNRVLDTYGSSLESFTEEFNKYDSELVDLYNKMNLYLCGVIA